MYKRLLDLKPALKRKSLFLFGPRQVGKTTYLKKHFKEALFIDLLDLTTLRELSVAPSHLEKLILLKKNNLVIIDEIQKMPELLNEVHKLIEKNKKLRFILTGSSARKLKKFGINLLGGRASTQFMLPLISKELKSKSFNLLNYLQWGGLPFVLESESPSEELHDYVSLYLQQEIKEEGLVRNFLNFTRFLDFAATTNGEQINFTSLGNDAQLPPRTVQDYYQILSDTLIGHNLPSYTKTKRKAVTTSKFYLMDVGVANYMNRKINLKIGTDDYGKALEHLVFCELFAYKNYQLPHPNQLYYWRTQTQLEVDFILETPENIFAIEVKSTQKPSKKHFNGLNAFLSEKPKAIAYLICSVKNSYKEGAITVISIEDFLELLWADKL